MSYASRRRREAPISDVGDEVGDILGGILEVERDTISPSSRFREDLDANSLAMVDVIMWVEEAFHVEIPDDKAEALLTVGDLIAFIKTQRHV